MTGKVITLPQRDEMLARLLAVNDDVKLRARFYPKILDYAGSAKTAQSVGMILMHAYHTYSDYLPDMEAICLHIELPDFVDAIAPDAEVARDAKVFLQKMLMTPE